MDRDFKLVMCILGIICAITILAYIAIGVVLVLLVTEIIPNIPQWVRILCSFGLVAYGYSTGYIIASSNADKQTKELMYNYEEEKGE